MNAHSGHLLTINDKMLKILWDTLKSLSSVEYNHVEKLLYRPAHPDAKSGTTASEPESIRLHYDGPQLHPFSSIAVYSTGTASGQLTVENKELKISFSTPYNSLYILEFISNLSPKECDNFTNVDWRSWTIGTKFTLMNN